MSESDDARLALVVLVGHGGFPQGVLDGAELILGPQEGMHAVGLSPDQDPSAVVDSVRELRGTGTTAPMLLLVDLFGGSPGNAVATAFLRDPDVEMVTGLNLPMVLEVSNRRKKAAGDLAALKGYAVSAGAAGVIDVGERLGL
ncbi:MAG TPA: PTS sugar transporter subunit IIA [Nocardioides sp.]|nr:PTS sugar transporter subunit IIA [Nocardioides sp.]